jgi:predicted TPR repeat methyltransferase
LTEKAQPQETLTEEPRDFFMTLRDIAFWVRSARADSALAAHLRDHDAAAAFDQLYASSSDPYASALPQFRYQRRKYRALVSMLPKRPYRNVLDVGCGLGVLSRELSRYVGHVLGIDLSAEAVTQARVLSAGIDNVEFARADITAASLGDVRYDLVVLADVVYYLTPLDEPMLQDLAARVAGMLAPGGLLLLVDHFFFTIDPPSRMTRKIHNVFGRSPLLRQFGERRRAFYLATLFERVANPIAGPR